MKKWQVFFSASLVACVGALAFLAAPAPACGCIETSPAAKKWTGCAYVASQKVGEHVFYENYLRARRDKLKLLPATPARFAELEKKIVKACGTYEQARQKDIKAGWESMHIPDDFVEARWH